MAVRLGFAVAVHTDPEVLLVDEVLAVGDAEFREKCLDRIAGMRQRGMTLVLVSHDEGLVNAYCTRLAELKSSRFAMTDRGDGRRALGVEARGAAASGQPSDGSTRQEAGSGF
jgi:ABC-type polysaccharide/polyol phosphate transport system ATPase subunit